MTIRALASTSIPLCLLVLLATGCGGEVGGSLDAAETDQLRAERGELTPRLLLSGELVADDAVRLVVPNANIWPVSVRWLIEDGAEVKAGDRVAEFDGSRLAGELENLENAVIQALSSRASARSSAASSIEGAEFELAQSQAAYDKAKLEGDLPEGLMAQQEMAQRRLDLEKAELDLEQARQAVESAREAAKASVEIEELKVRKARRALERARETLDALTLTAPRDGIALVAFNDREGRPFQTGDNTYPGLPVVTLPELSSLRVEAQLFDVDDGRAEAGQPVTATLDAFPDWNIPGTVRSVDRIADQTDSSSTRRRFRVAVDLEEIDTERMRPGMSVKLMVTAAPREALLVPRRALLFTDDGPRVRLAGGGEQEVELGECTPSHCEVTGGLEAGARLAGSSS